MRAKRITLTFAAVFLVLGLAAAAHAILSDVGPVSPTNGFPVFYRDTAGLALEPCLVNNGLCILLPDATFNPNLPVSFPANFPGELFFFIADHDPATLPASVRQIRFALEGTFLNGVPVNTQQMVFTRLRIRFDVPDPNATYTVTHPFGVKVLAPPHAPQGFTEDIPIAPLDFVGALNGNLGPFLRWDTGLPIFDAAGNQYIGDPGVPHTVTGSPFGTNFIQIDGPGINPGNLGGTGLNSVRSNLFFVAGKVFTGAIPSPLKVDRAAYTRDATGAGFVTVFATSIGTANLQVSGTGLTATNMVGDPATGKFFGYIPFAAGTTLPAAITVTNLSDVPPTVVTTALNDEVLITLAGYDVTTRALTVNALSSDLLAPLPALTAAGIGLMTFDALAGSWTVSAANVFVPPASVTVTSDKGGTETVKTSVIVSTAGTGPVAANDTVNTLENASVIIDVAANDTATLPATLNLASVAIVTQPLHGTLGANTGGTVSYTPALNFSGADSFVYVISDTNGLVSNNATVAITVTPVNSAPVLVNDTASTTPGTPVLINVLANDTDVDGTLNPNTLIIASGPFPSGTLFANTATGQVTYTPAAGFSGTATFTYNVSDNLGVAATTPATVTVTVLPAQEVILVQKAEFRTGSGYNISGTTNIPGATITIRLGTGTTGPIIATTRADAVGAWRYRPGVVTNPQPGTARTISVFSSGGGSLIGSPMVVR